MKSALRALLCARCYIAVVSVALLTFVAAEILPDVDATSVDQKPGVPAESREDKSNYSADVHLPFYSAVGRFTGTMVCTAAMVRHPQIIITAGHCVAGRDNEAIHSKPFFEPGYQAGKDLGRFSATVWAVGSQQKFRSQSVHEASNDWAILLLDRTPIGIRPFRLSSEIVDVQNPLEGRPILLPSYSIDGAGTLSLSIDPACSVRNLIWNVMVHDCKAFPGASGAPLLIRDGQWYAVVGIHSGALFAAADEKRHAMAFIGNSAIGTWTFLDAVQSLSRRLDRGDSFEEAGAIVY